MKITKARLKQIIREELQVTLTNEEAGEMFGDEVQERLEASTPQSINERKRLSDLVPGDFVEIEISSDGYDRSITPIEKDEYVNKLGAYVSQKMLAQLVEVAEDYEEEMYESTQSTLKESLDMDKLETLEVVIKDAYDQMTTPTDVDQVHAGTGEPVSKDPRDMHDKAVEFLKGVVEDVASGEMTSSPRTVNEDGHGDVESSRRAMKAIAEDAMQMLQALEQMDGNLPTWWTNKMANAKYMMNAMRDYLLIPSEMNEQ
jgi:hypothetical protein